MRKLAVSMAMFNSYMLNRGYQNLSHLRSINVLRNRLDNKITLYISLIGWQVDPFPAFHGSEIGLLAAGANFQRLQYRLQEWFRLQQQEFQGGTGAMWDQTGSENVATSDIAG